MILPLCKDDVEYNDSIAEAPPVPSHSEAYDVINKLMTVGGTR